MADGPHDGLFKYTFSSPEHAASELKEVLPARLVELADWNTLSLQSSEDSKFEVGRTDLFYSIQVQGNETFLYIVFEHESANKKRAAFRLLQYMVGKWADFAGDHPDAPLPPIIAVVLHHSKAGWAAATQFIDLLDLSPELREILTPYLPNFRYVLDDISKLTDDDFRARALTGLVKATFLALTRARGAKEVGKICGYLEECLQDVVKAPYGVDALNRVLLYFTKVTDIPPEELVTYVHDTYGETATEALMTTEEQILQKGIQKGLQAGRAEGIQAGRAERARELVRKLLASKFGELPTSALQCLNTASEAELDRYAERVLSANTLEAVFD